MTDRDQASSWLHYQTADTRVMLSPAVIHRSDPQWSRHAISALTRPELGLLPHGVRYVLALDDSLRLECAAADASQLTQGQADACTPAGELLAVYETEHRVWLDAAQAGVAAQALGHGVESDDLEADVEEPALPEHWAALREVAESITTDAVLSESFRTDPSAPWGLFMFADEEFVSVEADRNDAFVRFDRALTLPVSAPEQAITLIEWLLRINSMSVIGPRASLQIETDTELPLISIVLPRRSLHALTIRDAITELDARARSIEAQWLRLASAVAEPSSVAVSNTWLRG